MFKFLKEKIGGWIKSISGKSEKRKKEKKERKFKGKKVKGKKKLVEKITKEERKVEEVQPETTRLAEEKIEEVQPEEAKEKKGWFASLFDKFTKARLTEEIFEEIFSQLELILLENNVAYQVVQEIKKELKNKLLDREIDKKKIEETIKHSLKDVIDNILIEPFDLVEKIKSKSPYIIVFFGINGSGKTTTIAKLAYMLQKNKISSVIAAADTFRAASIEQLEEHGRKLGVEIVKQAYGADPAAVAFDAIKHAQARGIQAVLIDTAGRMHTKENLMREMEKICRVAKPDLKIFVAESITGNDVVEPAKIFNESVGIDGIILSKADIDEKGGAILSVGYITRNPILFLGTGQEYKDLEKFDRKKFIKSLGLE
ncbi:MAG: signal recognition particle-docking protein FtsY [Candidatus Pacearchaeota archaeon]